MSKLVNRCVFCGENADTREHVFAKCFFDCPYPNGLLTVPSCKKCNSGYSKDEQYLMYLVDYLKSVENNNGEFMREIARKTFQHNESLENRMVVSLSADMMEQPSFAIEVERVNRVVDKIARCIYFYHFGRVVSSNQLECRWSFLTQLNVVQKKSIEQIEFTTIQEGLVKYYYSSQEIGFCLSEFFYGCAKIYDS